jgi:hypothetical protein
MPAYADYDDLKNVSNEIESLKMKYPDAFKEFANLINTRRRIGYKNLCKMMMGSTPEELKGLDE